MFFKIDLDNIVFTNEIWRQVAHQEITAAPLFSIMCCSSYLYITLCMSAVNINAVIQNYFISYYKQLGVVISNSRKSVYIRRLKAHKW